MGTWWGVRGEPFGLRGEKLKHRFLEVIEDLVTDRQLLVKTKGIDGKSHIAKFDRLRLLNEIDRADQPDPEGFYWFGVP
jgi:hypothetical protein